MNFDRQTQSNINLDIPLIDSSSEIEQFHSVVQTSRQRKQVVLANRGDRDFVEQFRLYPVGGLSAEDSSAVEL